MNLSEYVVRHVVRGECKCGRCLDVGDAPDPVGHTADVFFFKVSARDAPMKDDLMKAVEEHRGVFAECVPFDGKEHSYIELGGWLGDQGLALMFMGLSELVGAAQIMSPLMLGMERDDSLAQQMAGMGMVTIQTIGEGFTHE